MADARTINKKPYNSRLSAINGSNPHPGREQYKQFKITLRLIEGFTCQPLQSPTNKLLIGIEQRTKRISYAHHFEYKD
jgi:uncharacterized protein (DUF2461 family)